jgi:hypothetical protein
MRAHDDGAFAFIMYQHAAVQLYAAIASLVPVA